MCAHTQGSSESDVKEVVEVIWSRKYKQTAQFTTIPELWHFKLLVYFFVYSCVGVFIMSQGGT